MLVFGVDMGCGRWNSFDFGVRYYCDEIGWDVIEDLCRVDEGVCEDW